MKHDRELLANLATLRELSGDSRAAVLDHTRTCAECSIRLAAYERQDAALAALPQLTSRVSYAQLVDEAAPASARRTLRGAPAFILTLVLLLALCVPAVAASGSALPGETLYPVKLGVEAVQRALTINAEKRSELDARLTQRRVNEAEALLEKGRTQEMTIVGELTGTEGGEWTVSGLQIAVSEQLRAAGEPEPGTRVRMRIVIEEGHAWARSIDIIGVGAGNTEHGRTEEAGTPGAVRNERAATAAAPAHTPQSGAPAATVSSASGAGTSHRPVTPGEGGAAAHSTPTPRPHATGAADDHGAGQSEHSSSGNGTGSGSGGGQ